MDEYTPRPRNRKRRIRRKRILPRPLLLLMLLLLVIGLILVARHFLPHKYYTAKELGITELQSPIDADGDGVDDWTDMMLGAREYIHTKPHYKSKYYGGGYPDDGLGVCTDVVWHAFQAAGYTLKDMVDADIAENREYYPNIETPDGNIDFRRVSNLGTFFCRYAQVLTCDLSDPEQWQPGDIVIFGNRDHIGICSDRRNAKGIPFLIHHGNPIDDAVEQDYISTHDVTEHYRWLG
ncbi:MAG: DUF1287 domain-containing protein [Eubacteriales bacterium]|nr:DUF1287 domain-containing protein [Eubacteriales bacterium]